MARSGFDDITFDSSHEVGCSPTFEDYSYDRREIKINAPGRVQAILDDDGMSPETRFPICLAMQFPTKLVGDTFELWARITLVAVNVVTGESFSGNLVPRRTAQRIPGPPLAPEVLEKRVERFYRNINLCHYVHLPAERGSYHVYAMFEDYRSNTVTVELE